MTPASGTPIVSAMLATGNIVRSSSRTRSSGDGSGRPSASWMRWTKSIVHPISAHAWA